MHPEKAPVAKLVDALDLGSSVFRRVGSSPIRRTEQKCQVHVCHDAWLFFIVYNNIIQPYHYCCLRSSCLSPDLQFVL